ncbi:hypothetical protein [Streptomyces sp. SID3343]|uniref:hypothetical protein n=1 Tax=Streptomyces sp. SID3343 TaxID=2690260 RepID=UPI001371198E|nr:hypothetical protein [Streptomyces sp. SID3343]MYW04503.1 hypothetical protein [Streptomyces sp. SID3343]
MSASSTATRRVPPRRCSSCEGVGTRRVKCVRTIDGHTTIIPGREKCPLCTGKGVR